MKRVDRPWLSQSQQRVWRQWLTANAELGTAVGRQLTQDNGISAPDFHVLVRLSEEPGQRVRIVELARGMQWERSRLSHHLTRMEKRGLVLRRDCPEDGRGQFAELTDEGRRAVEQAAPGHAELVRSVLFDHLSDDELDVLDRVTEALIERVRCSGFGDGAQEQQP
ncbi:MAG TPA: MarR family transcriptional regulator [Ornithinimicrobium sp.]|uniref:MarR family winged helix-turn-helix transcriptional regulator n=1 Tax=Ornithinimicrobium sp. TaxID=1977084 RepID=UPI002B47B37F|nr:MarR family transcriptional regulator [Ornithinimicrobium sp.]HKJ10833.1 MarR family transcriptional regulator [Ornithinimicrobium sp.]